MNTDQLKIEINLAVPLLEKYMDDIRNEVSQNIISQAVMDYANVRLESVKKALSDSGLSIKQVGLLCIPATLDLRQAIKHYPSDAYIYDNWVEAFTFVFDGDTISQSDEID